jgi:disulfide bond formation protein DsbB
MMKSLPLARFLALAVPLLLLGGAYASQYIGGLHPCEMCWWQRYPHFIAIPLTLIAYGMKQRPGISGAIGLFHAGVEYGWWQGLTACSTSPAAGNPADILNQIMATPITRCDVAPWTLMGISLAGFNGLLSGASALAILGLLTKARKEA